MIHAYEKMYVAVAQRKLGWMFQLAAVSEGMDIDEFAEAFLSSKIARAFEVANPIYVLGKSGVEMLEIVLNRKLQTVVQPTGYTSAYWVGWVLAYAQWYLNRPFRKIIDAFPCSKLEMHYFPYHEMDISKCLELVKQKISYVCPLKEYRTRMNLTQKELAERSEVSVSSIKAYEQGKADIASARGRTLYCLAKALNCSIEELIC